MRACPVIALTLAATAAACGGSGEPVRLDGPAPRATIVQVTDDTHKLTLDPSRDYILRSPRKGVSPPGGVVIEGGRNVTWTDARIVVHTPPDPKRKHAGRALYLLRQTGTVLLRRLHLGGPGLTEGIDIAAPKATVILRDVRIDRVHRPPGLPTHPDVIQTWSGPRKLVVDGLTAVTDYQGFFLVPEAYGPVDLERWTLRRVRLVGTSRAGYLLWRPRTLSVRIDDVRLRWNNRRRQITNILWPSPRDWRGVRHGR